MHEPLPARPGAIFREFAAFLRRPQVLTPSGLRAPGAWRRWTQLVILQIGVLVLVLLPFIRFWQKAFALPSPEAFGELPTGMLVPTVVLIAPMIEETLFRGWLTGRVRALWLLGCALAAVAVLVASTHGMSAPAAGGGLLAAGIAAGAGWVTLRRRTDVPGWFAKGFPAIFYAMVTVFAASHLANYPHPSLLALALVLPQAWGALVLGFVRMRIGLPAAILAHAAANASTLALAMALS